MELGTVIFTKTASTGVAVEIILNEVDIRPSGHIDLSLRVVVGGQPGPSTVSGPYRIKPQQGYQWAIGEKPAAALSDAEAERITATISAIKADAQAAFAATPEGHEAALRATRSDLLSTYRGLYDEQAHQFDRAHSHEDPMAWSIKESFESKIEAARQALAAFDAAHPEVLATLKAEKGAEHARSFIARGLD